MSEVDPQASEIGSPEDRLSTELRRLLLAVEASGRGVLPRTNLDLLDSIVEAAARIFNAAAASIALVNEPDQALEFKVAYGSGRNDVVGMKIPLNKGIAGYVAMTGQPIAISNVQQDPRFNRDFAQSTGYVPRSILATPLLSGERVIGVMEVLDKIAAPSFGIQDMELLALFARQAAIAIHQSQQYEHIDEALITGLKRLAEENLPGQSSADSTTDLTKTLDQIQAISSTAKVAAPKSGDSGQDLQELADLFYQISSLGDAERKACLKVLRAFAEYSRARPRFAR